MWPIYLGWFHWYAWVLMASNFFYKFCYSCGSCNLYFTEIDIKSCSKIICCLFFCVLFLSNIKNAVTLFQWTVMNLTIPWLTKYYAENQRLTKANLTHIRRWTQMLRKGRQFFLALWHPLWVIIWSTIDHTMTNAYTTFIISH